VALGFLTIVPVGALGRSDRLDPALAWFPLVGAGVGAAAGGVFAGLRGAVGAGPAAVAALTATAVLTGALHLDGLADACDGLGARGGAERRLAVMRDSALGTFGGLALLVWALGWFAALAPLSGGHAVRTLICAASLARLTALGHARLTPPARPDGLGAGFSVPPPALGAAAVLAGAAMLLSVGPARTEVALACALAVMAATSYGARRALGGRTGDTLGATVALTELSVLIALAAAW
jgi:adenosylcobinamide-GDP ribazoletransferase